MGLSEQLAAFNAEFARIAPAGRPAVYEAKIEEPLRSFARKEAVAAGDQGPDFSLPDVRGNSVSLFGLLQKGPVVVSFYRGGWCPYCNIRLRAYEAILPQIRALGGSLAAISPQLPDGSRGTAETNALTFPVLSDVGNHAARSFGLVYSLPTSYARHCVRTTRRFQESMAMRVGNCRFPRLTLSGPTDASRLPISRSTIASGLNRTRSSPL